MTYNSEIKQLFVVNETKSVFTANVFTTNYSIVDTLIFKLDIEQAI